jgi:hypothetical protein
MGIETGTGMGIEILVTATQETDPDACLSQTEQGELFVTSRPARPYLEPFWQVISL